MTTPTVTTSALHFPGFQLADILPKGGWLKRGSVPSSRLPHFDGDQKPCPTNGHLPVGRIGLTCTAHRDGWHVAASLGRVLAAWPDRSVAR